MSNTEAESIIKLATPRTIFEPSDIPGVVHVAHADDWTHALVDFETYLPNPRRKKGFVELEDGMSFALYVRQQMTPDTVIFAAKNTLTAVFNHHQQNEPGNNSDIAAYGIDAGWNDHQAAFTMRFTPAWQAWTGFDDRWIEQGSFAEFLEERITEIAHPDGAMLLEIVRTLRMKVETTWQRVVTLQNDAVQLTYTDDISTGDVTIPEKLTLVLTPFDGAQAVPIEARLRFTKPDSRGQVKFMFKLGETVQKTLDDALDAVIKTVTESTGVQVLRGRLAK